MARLTAINSGKDPKSRTLRYMLRQMRQAGRAWSDGQKIWEGLEFDALRAKTVNLSVSHRAGSKAPATAMAWHNLSVHLGLLQRISKREHPEQPRQSEDLLKKIVLEQWQSKAGNSVQRVTIARRALRKHFPEVYASLELRHRLSERELEAVVSSMQRCGLRLAEDYSPRQGVNFSAGACVHVDSQGKVAVGPCDFRWPVPLEIVSKGKDPRLVSEIRNVLSEPGFG